jgi:ABC-type multidrug transport system ATPase subunit
MRFVRDIAKKYKVLVIASIHQPSTTTFELFDKLMLLSRGKVCYNGPVKEVKDYFAGLGYNVSQPNQLTQSFRKGLSNLRCHSTPTPQNS